MNKRLESLDILRGADLFLLTILGPLVSRISCTGEYGWENVIMPCCEHVEWEGFVLWDLIMPLFMFMSGTTIPYSMAHKKSYTRIFRRFLVLWIFGMIAQGGLLKLDFTELRFFSNTLQAIAVGYLFSALLFMWFKPKVRIVIAAVLLLSYWAAMTFIGGGDYTPNGNLCYIVDNAVLGCHRDFPGDPQYQYTWILSSLNFIVTVMTGTFAGEILRNPTEDDRHKVIIMLGIGIGMLATGCLWGTVHPVIKKIWTGSMTLVASGYSFLALAAVYYIVDYKKRGDGLKWLKIWGMNSILAYMMCQVLRFDSIPYSIFYGFEQFLSPEWYKFLVTAGCLAVETFILWALYKRNIFLKV